MEIKNIYDHEYFIEEYFHGTVNAMVDKPIRFKLGLYNKHAPLETKGDEETCPLAH